MDFDRQLMLRSHSALKPLDRADVDPLDKMIKMHRKDLRKVQELTQKLLIESYQLELQNLYEGIIQGCEFLLRRGRSGVAANNDYYDDAQQQQQRQRRR
jgi:hypothetical protein